MIIKKENYSFLLFELNEKLFHQYFIIQIKLWKRNKKSDLNVILRKTLYVKNK